MRAPTTSWWWNDTPCEPIERVFGLPTSWSSAASRTMSDGPRLGHDRDRVGEHVLVAVDRVLLDPHGRQLGQDDVGEAGVDEEPQAGGRVVDHEQLVELVADPLGRHDLEPADACSRTAATSAVVGREAVAGDEPGRPQHPQRVVGEGHLRATAACGARRRPGRPTPPNGSMSSGASSSAPVTRSAMALTVKSRRERSASTSSAKVTSGLRESGE